MPTYTLENQALRLTVSTLGAEILALTDRTTQREYIWQGDDQLWSGHAPILFPNVGSTWQGTTLIHGHQHHFPKHGWVREREWHVVAQSPSSITLAVERNEAEAAIFPWHYRLEVCYTLSDRTLRADFHVRNLTAGTTMWFQLGGHPSVVLTDSPRPADGVRGFLRFVGEPESLIRAGEQGCIEAARVAIPWSNDVDTATALARNHTANALVPICVDTFAHEALILDRTQISAVEVLDLAHKCVARISSSAPVFLIWAPQGQSSPFLCVEPWYGAPDNIGFAGSIEERPYIQQVSSTEAWHGWFTMEV